MVELYREVYGEAVPNATVQQFATDWLNTKKAETVSEQEEREVWAAEPNGKSDLSGN